MPFIWNDVDYRFIGSDEPYDTSLYTVARKLYVELRLPPAALTEDKISKVLGKYGAIEKVELHQLNCDRYWTHWAHVTFFSDRDACFALLNELNNKEELKLISDIMPASTWHQPRIGAPIIAHSSEEANRTSLLHLNDHCLLKVFSYCDFNTKANLWQVCTRTQNLLDEFVLPKEKTEYKIVWDFCLEPPLQTLKRVRDELKYIGSHVKKLRLVVQVDDENDWYYYDDPPALDRVLEKCNKYAVASIKELELVRMPNAIFEGRNLVLLRPILDKIEMLTIENDKKWKNPVDVELPKLKHLLILPDELAGNGGLDLIFVHKNLSTLEKLTLRHVADEREMPTLETCLRNNSKLKCLEMHATNFKELAEETITSMKNLEELTVLDFFEDCDNTKCFAKLGKLRKLGLSFNDYFAIQYDSMDVIENACKNKNLQTLMLAVIEDSYREFDQEYYFEMIMLSARELPRLKHLYIKFALSTSNIIEIVQTARNLNTLWVVYPLKEETKLTFDFLKTLADIRKSQFGNRVDKTASLDFIYGIWYQSGAEITAKMVQEDEEVSKYVKLHLRESEEYFPEFP